MGLLGALGMMMCFWGTVTGKAPPTVGPCVHSSREGWYSQKKLTGIIGHTWPNATELDLSQNCLNLTHSKSLHKMQKFGRLVMLNLSGNYLPLLERNHLSRLSALKVLDLSRCQLVGIENGAFQGLPNLQTLLLGGNKLQDPLPTALRDLRALSVLDLHGNGHIKNGPPEWIKGVQRVFWPGSTGFMPPGNKSEGHVQNLNILRTFQRKLLSDINEDPTTPSINSTDTSKERPSHSWQYLVAVLVTAILISIIITLGAKCKIVHRYLASYRHTLLPEGDAVSQCDPMSLEVGFSGQDVMGRGPPTELDDDDGFIEDNYIQACERERAERAAEEMEGEDEDDGIQFTIG
ncbi:type III endosome membrane protein TEMP [Anguilla rostrata]|uniref:LRRCT domain-containing protein n=1 Tax=Anguilla anguilla TaxID=7936 RepID=A0A9D3MKQ9_ANGAN|nr:type III endosome membrane protein TEMP [Anguilla anguilla]KAG5850684.1 hypothetical protein ANANG_G00085060 [Anguilla anguilla]